MKKSKIFFNILHIHSVFQFSVALGALLRAAQWHCAEVHATQFCCLLQSFFSFTCSLALQRFCKNFFRFLKFNQVIIHPFFFQFRVLSSFHFSSNVEYGSISCSGPVPSIIIIIIIFTINSSSIDPEQCGTKLD